MGINEILSNEESRELFRAFCDQTYSSENIHFWEAVQEYQNITDAVLLPLRARAIYEKFLMPGAAFQVNVDDGILADVLPQIESESVTPQLFNDAQAYALMLMDHDTLPKFVSHQGKAKQGNAASGASSEGIKVVGSWNHSSAPSDSGLAKKLEKELERIDFQKAHVGLDTLRVEEENARLDAWCRLLERDCDTNKRQIAALTQTLQKLNEETTFLQHREQKLERTLEEARGSLRSHLATLE